MHEGSQRKKRYLQLKKIKIKKIRDSDYSNFITKPLLIRIISGKIETKIFRSNENIST